MAITDIAITEQNRNSVVASPVIKMRSTLFPQIQKVYGQIFYATDEGRMYLDTIDGARLPDLSITVLQTESERLNINPSNFDGDRFYVVETNVLFRCISGSWTIERGRIEREVAQTYYPNGQLVRIYSDDVSGNGILGDGSVVVRDENRTISGILSSDSFSLNVASLAGNQINLNPSSNHQGSGSLVLNANLFENEDNNNSALYNGDLYVFGTINKVSPAKWDSRYRVLSKVTLIDSESILLSGSFIEAGSMLDSTKIEDRGFVLEEDMTVNTGSLTSGTKLIYGSTVNGSSVTPPYIFDLSQSASIPDFQSLPFTSFSIDDKTLTVSEVREATLGSEIFFDFSGAVLSEPFNKIIVDGKPFEIIGDSEVNVTKFALVKIVTLSQFVLLKGI